MRTVALKDSYSMRMCGWILLSTMWFGILTGCGAKNGDVLFSGYVTLDKQPLPDGVIVFLPVNGAGPSRGAKIAGGRYEVRLAPGEKSVSISANRFVKKQECTPGKPEDGSYDITVQYIPAQYNTETKLTTTVPSGGGIADFDLATAP